MDMLLGHSMSIILKVPWLSLLLQRLKIVLPSCRCVRVQSIFPFLLSVSVKSNSKFRSLYLKQSGNYSLKTPSHDNVLQIHPGALNHGGYPLVSCCIAAAKHAKVWPPYPISLHFFIVLNLLKKFFLSKHAHTHLLGILLHVTCFDREPPPSNRGW